MQAFDLTNVMADTVSLETGYWSRKVESAKRSYIVSITRNAGEEVYTVCAHSKPTFNSSYGVHIAGYTGSLKEAVKLANETAHQLKSHDLFITIRDDNSVGSKVLVKR